MAIYNIPDFKIEELEKRITYISKKCEKYGNPFSYLKGLQDPECHSQYDIENIIKKEGKQRQHELFSQVHNLTFQSL